MILVPSPHAYVSHTEHGAVLIAAHTNKIHVLNRSAAALWRTLVEHQGDLDRAINDVASNYGVDTDSITPGVGRFVEVLLACGLVERPR